LLQRVNPGHKSFADYRSIVHRELYEEVVELSERLEGARVLHVNATAFGGGVAEILYTLVPLMRDVGLECEWEVMFGAEAFFNVTKSFHNALQGADYELTIEDRAIFEEYNRQSAAALDSEFDIMFIHDPQPALLKHFAEHLPESAKWIWRCHIDTSTPNRQVMDYLTPYIQEYDAQIFTMQEYTPPDIELPKLVLIPPAIDPLSPKNMALPAEDAHYIVDQFGVDANRPILLQVSRFDPWKDPLGVIDAYRLVKEQVPEVQLVLVGSMAHDDPEGWEYWQKTTEHAAGDEDIFLFSNLTNVGSIEVNAFQSRADVVIQKSIREGFGLVVTEALWKARPTVASRVGGIPMQIPDGCGLLVDSIEETAVACVKLIQNRELAREMGLRGKEYVRRHFLTPRLLRDDLKLFTELLGV
jgi:trehalose synthase